MLRKQLVTLSNKIRMLLKRKRADSSVATAERRKFANWGLLLKVCKVGAIVDIVFGLFTASSSRVAMNKRYVKSYLATRSIASICLNMLPRASKLAFDLSRS
jgi:hypothetical protein